MGNHILQFAGWYTEDEPGRPAMHEQHEIGEGEAACIRYDRETDSLAVLPADCPRPAAAIVTGHAGHWCLTNLHAEDTYFIENMEHGGEFVKVAARRRDFPVPFELARLVLPVARRIGIVNVFGPEPRYLTVASASGATTNWPRLDEHSAYFRVLVALCEPQLRGYPPGAVPTIADVIARLQETACAPAMSRAAVNHHINYLATEKLQVTEWAGVADGKRSYWKREAIVAMALRSGLVGEQHLRLLPARCGSAARRAGAGSRPAGQDTRRAGARHLSGPQEPFPSYGPVPPRRPGR